MDLPADAPPLRRQRPQRQPRVLDAIGEVLVPEGLFYMGTWGGADEEGPMRDGHHRVPRFFAFRSDQLMTEILAERFHVLSFTTFDVDRNHFQSLCSRSRGSRWVSAKI
jgi:hypothetical protein